MEWGKFNKLCFNTGECKVMSYSRTIEPYDYTLYTRVSSMVIDLGDTMTKDFVYTKLIVDINTKAFRNF